MHQYYKDILEHVSEPPRWFDENAVPRFCEFLPKEAAHIYASEVTLLLIECQACATRFKVALSELNLRDVLWDSSKRKVKNISDLIADRSIHYGDPPNVRCCDTGPTMNSVAIRVLEYWYKPVVRGEGLVGRKIRDPQALNFQRDPEFEIDVRNRGGRQTG